MENPQRNPVEHAPGAAGVDRAALRALAAAAAAAHGLDLVDVEWTGGLLRVTIDRPSAGDAPTGVTIDDCAAVSRDLSTALDVADLIAHAYQLEVSSPGLDRKLGPGDWSRYLGRSVKCKLVRPTSDGQLTLRGVLSSASDAAIRVIADGKPFDVPLSDIRDAKLVFEPAAANKPKRAKKSRK